MTSATASATPGLRVHIPDVRVTKVEVVGEDILATVGPQQETGAFGGEFLQEVLIHKDPDLSGRAEILARYNYVTREITQDALDQFLGISRAEDVAAFVQKWGPLTDPTSVPLWFAVQQAEQMKVLLRLAGAIRNSRDDDLQEALVDAGEAGIDIMGSDAPSAIAFHLTKHLTVSVPALLPGREGLMPVLICKTVVTGLYGLLLESVASGNPWEVCEYEHCRRHFKTSNATKRFCSPRCQKIDKQRRYRKNQEQKPKTATKKKTGRKVTKKKLRKQ